MNEKIQNLIKNLDEEQKKAVTGEIKDSLVVANAGSGKCVLGNTLIYTNKGLIKIEDIPKFFEINDDDSKCIAEIISYTTNGERLLKNTSHWFNMGESKTIRIQTNSGYSIEGTPEHPIIVLNEKGTCEFKQLRHIKKGDYVAISLNNNLWSTENSIDEDTAYFLGTKIVLFKNSEIPFSILQSTKKVVVSFLQGLFDTYSNINENEIELSSVSANIVRQLQIILLNFGIKSKIIQEEKEEEIYKISISGLALRRYKEEIGYKLNTIAREKLERKIFNICNSDEDLPILVQKSDNFKKAVNDFWTYFEEQKQTNSDNIDIILSYLNENEGFSYFNNIKENLFFETIDVIEEGIAVVYDFTVPDIHSFVSNGIISHNTTVLTHRVAYYILNDISPKQIMLLTFTNKASEEMLERVKKIIGNMNCDVLGGTFHHIANIFLRRYSKLIGFGNNFGILTPDDAESLIKKIIPNVVTEYSEEFQDNFPSHKVIFGIYSTAFNKNMDISSYIEKAQYGFSEEVVECIKRILFMYKNEKKEMELLDFDDLLKYFYLLLKQKPQVRERINDEYPYILVDEYQDVNWIQNEIIELLNDKYHYLFVVGDKNQCLMPFTKITSKDGNLSIQENIEDINKSNQILYFNGEKLEFSKEIEKIKREYNGFIYTITTKSNKVISGTGKHILFRKINKNIIKNALKSDTINFIMLGKNMYALDINISNNKILEVLKKYFSSIDNVIDCIYMNDYDKLYKIYDSILNELDKLNIDYNTNCYLRVNNDFYIFTPFEDLLVNDEVIVIINNNLINDSVTNISKEEYSGYVYDINVDNYRNYLANDFLVHNCIYGWRGSNPTHIEQFEDKYVNCNVYFITNNYRSHAEILALAEDSINNNNNRYPTKIVPYKNKLALPSIIKTENDYTQIEYICSKIKEYKRLGVPYKEMCILIRANYLTRYLEMTLNRNRIPYKILCGVSFFEREHIKDMLCFLKYLANPKDSISLMRILGLFKGMGNAKIKIIFDNIIDNDLFTFNGNLKNKNATESLNILLDILIQMKEEDNVSNQIRYLYDNFYRSYLYNNFENAKEREMDIISLLESSTLYKDVSVFISEILLDNISKEEKEKNKEEKDDMVIITTFHKSKGLEWDALFLPYLNKGTFPSHKSLSDEEIEEERRLFYVGVTRARKFLNISYIQRDNNGEKEKSMFLKELNKNLYKDIKYKDLSIFDEIKFTFEY